MVLHGTECGKAMTAPCMVVACPYMLHPTTGAVLVILSQAILVWDKITNTALAGRHGNAQARAPPNIMRSIPMRTRNPRRHHALGSENATRDSGSIL